MNPRSWHGDDAVLWIGDCRDVLPSFADARFDAIVTDPPYDLTPRMARAGGGPSELGRTRPAGRGFMGQAWDGTGVAFDPATWTECLRVLKPGGYAISFGGSRTWHRLACAVEDAGFEMRDSIAWLYGSGFPKSLDVSKAVDKAVGAEGRWERQDHPGRPGARTRDTSIIGQTNHATEDNPDGLRHVYRPDSDEARRWQGWGTALKPAFEPIVVARKPLAGSVAANVLEHGTGALNVDGCRVAHASDADRAESEGKNRHAAFGSSPGGLNVYGDYSQTQVRDYDGSAGRWPPNVVLTHAGDCGHAACAPGCPVAALGEEGRFFPAFRYEAKADTAERPRDGDVLHPTVKPLELMRWLVRLVTPPGGLVLDPFVGSGTTLEACIAEGFRGVAVERDETYEGVIAARMARPVAQVLL